MQKLIATLFVLIQLSAFAQTANQLPERWCGSVVPESFRQVYAARDRSNYEGYMHSRSGKRYIPVVYHIITKSNGTGGAPLSVIFPSHCELNLSYDTAGIGFYIRKIDTVKSDNLYDLQNQSYAYFAFQQYNVTNVCNIYVSGNLPGLCGFATFPNTAPRGGGVFMNQSCIGEGTKTLPHETGHFFGLLHTFDSSNGVEFVNGSNCATAGDLMCDTPADFIDYRAPCPYLGDSTDPNGDLYRTVIDPSLLMSYFYDNCVYRFSPMQQVEMNQTLSNALAPLLNQSMPDLTPLDSVPLIYPVNGTAIFNSAYGVFRWNSVPRAQYYRIHLQSATSSLVVADTVVTDTFFVTNAIKPNKNYKFRVQPISFGNTCGENANYQVFHSSAVKAAVEITQPSCSQNNMGAITVTPSGGTGPYQFLWSDGSTSQDLTGLNAGEYSVTVSDNNGVSVASLFELVDSPSVNAVVTQNGSTLVVGATGGTPPYSYNWSNGVTTAQNNVADVGSYSVTVTDSKGCTSVKSVTYTSINSVAETKVDMKIFPNPLAGTNTLNVQLVCNETTHGLVTLMNLNGEILQQVKKDFGNGINNLQLNADQLSTGIYFVQFKANGLLKTEKVSVIK
jgi:hypothetical protein